MSVMPILIYSPSIELIIITLFNFQDVCWCSLKAAFKKKKIACHSSDVKFSVWFILLFQILVFYLEASNGINSPLC